MAGPEENIALFDMDGTLCDFDKAMEESLEKIRSPEEEPYTGKPEEAPKHIKERKELIMSSRNWWSTMPKFQIGWDILEAAKEAGFKIHILTQGPRRNPSGWKGKKVWVDRNLGPDTDITMTRDKGLVYGKVLVDDYPEYIKRWLQWRERALVIMPAGKNNNEFKHPNVIRYDGTNLEEVKEAMKKAYERKISEEVKY
ncbi:hypothetical protein COU61_03180 [Candidatus Pacearchaeota archaeon CG10_big_fil_rev_8_21_14_0_10_35_13]|nr:MAG: hypothetical protein COU61_03180 [Candidatus Pacearchaeota archaeon CG10_big_fil_rev_8_21_14_0_10_35_13]